MDYYATFDKEHRHPTTGENMEGYYVKVTAADEEAARFALFGLFSESWKFLYPSHEFSQMSCPKGEYATCIAKDFNPKPGIITG